MSLSMGSGDDLFYELTKISDIKATKALKTVSSSQLRWRSINLPKSVLHVQIVLIKPVAFIFFIFSFPSQRSITIQNSS